MRSIARTLGESVLGGRATCHRLARILSPSAVVLAFHNVIPDGEKQRGDRSLHLGLSSFRSILDWLPELFDVVPVNAIVEGTPADWSRPRAAITFDDAYAGAIDLGVPELLRRRMPATIFALGEMQDGQTFWWDALGDPAGGLAPLIRKEALVAAQGREQEVRSLARNRGWPFAELQGPFVATRWENLAAVARQPGFEVAHHTRTHANAAVLGRAELTDELEGGRGALESRIPDARPWLAWPYGLSSSRAMCVAREAGFEFAFRVDGGAWRAGDPPPPRFRFPRLNVPSGITPEGLRLRAVGLLGR